VTDEAPLDVDALLASIDRHMVAYVVTGSIAAAAHGAPDVQPGDLDIVPATDAPNLDRLGRALQEIGGHASPEPGHWARDELDEWAWVTDPEPHPVRPLDPADPDTFDHSFRTRHGRLDVVPVVAGSYESLRARASRRSVAGHRPWVAHPLDVLAGMSRPRRRKDVPRVRHLRSVAGRRSAGVGFVGLRTDRFDEMVGLFRDLVGLDVVREAPGATWFRLGTDAELHVYAADDPQHAFFTTGPVVGLRVDDVDATRARMAVAGVEMLTDVERTHTGGWCHFRAPDGTVLEIIGPSDTS
jgi:hypothetical protein